MTARADCSIWLDGDEAPTVRAQALAPTADNDAPRALVAITDILTIFGPVDTLRATLVAALEALDGIQP